MEDYMMQKFSRDWLEEKLQVFYEQFDQLADSGGELTDKERDQLKQSWDDIQKEGEKRLQNLRDTLKL
ncbi:hypothetical protein M8994_21015, partial [Brucella sp. 21LCYQ03]|nr:hypothetical protein [Brucella sp. 21LCYQ03]